MSGDVETRLTPRAISGTIVMCIFDLGMVPVTKLQSPRNIP